MKSRAIWPLCCAVLFVLPTFGSAQTTKTPDKVANEKPKVYKTPEEVFNASLTYYKRNDFRREFACFTTEYKNQVSGRVVVMALYVRLFLQLNKEKENIDDYRRIDKAFASHGIEGRSLVDLTVELVRRKLTPSEKYTGELGAKIKKQEDFYKEMSVLLNELQKKYKQLTYQEMSGGTESTRLKNAQITNDSAIGTADLTISGDDTIQIISSRIRFRRVNGSWLIDWLDLRR